MDSSAWSHMCSSFHIATSELCAALVGKCICISYVDPMGLRAFVGGRTEANHNRDKPTLKHNPGTLTGDDKGMKSFAIYGVPVLRAYK